MPRFVPDATALLRMPTAPVALGHSTRVERGAADFLGRVLADPALREAVELSSDVLAAALDAVAAGTADQAKVERAARTVARYLLRMTGRPTPFGLHAGVAVAEFDSATKVRLGAAHRKGVRADAGWLTAVLTDLECRPEVLRHLRVTANDLCFERGDRLVLPYARGDDGPMAELSIRRTAPVAAAIAAARRPVAVADLAAKLAADFPQAAAAAIEAMIGQLVARELLLTDLQPSLVGTDLLDHAIDRLGDRPEAAALTEIRDLLADYAAAPIGEGLPAWRRVTAAMRAVRPADRAPVQVDLRVDAEVRLPHEVGAEAARAAAVLSRLADPLPEHLRQYRDAFVERYGSHQVVPLAELIDPERGLGAPAGYRVPESERHLTPPTHGDVRDDALAALAQMTLLSGGTELVLDDTLVDRLAPDVPAPASTELCVRVLAESAAALDAGEFQLVVAPAVGSPNAGEMFARFAYLFDGAPDPRDDGDLLAAQLTFRPLHGRMGNLLQVPAVCAHTLAIGTFAERDRPDVLGVDDIAVGVDGGRLFLAAPRLGKEVLPVSPHRINLTTSSANVVRLIREITSAGHSRMEGWWWGKVAGRLPMQPRVRYGRTVLAAATWRASDPMRDRSLSWAEWNRELDAWRARWRVPERVSAVDSDAGLELDLGSGLHRALLRDELTRRPQTVVTEVIGTDADTGWLDGYAAEIVVPLRGADPRRPAAVIRQAPPTRAHLPGGEWVYAKLYAARARHDELLADHVGLLWSTVDRWFFIRYADPDPHLRLRLHAGQEALPILHDWAARLCAEGLASRLVLDTYEPESARYGGPELLPAAEAAFHADSVAAMAQLRLPVPSELLVAANYVDILRSFGDPDWDEWLLDHYTKGEHHKAFQRSRAQALDLISPYEGWPAMPTQALDAWRDRAPALAAYGEAARAANAPRDQILSALLHMHHNRLIGIDPDAEARSLAIARGAVEAHRNRIRHGA
ncbi:lantibiotic dehydratase [Actinokineospora sp. HUAS TT18]|uniref:lantibiotic dehydratase n=1 Tax=Actinokineospora sp. HUAS TT18 TaxID=3447451 RepID=UPI003F51AF86